MRELCLNINDKERKVCERKDGFKIILQGEKEYIKLTEEISNLKETCSRLNINIAEVIVQEWKELWVYVKGDSVEIDEVYFGEKKADRKPNGWWAFTFQNFLGKSFIRVKLKNGQELITDPIEVVSSKTPMDNERDPLYYPRFLKALIDSLIEHIVSAPFDLGSPTEFSTEEYAQPPSLISILHVLTQNADNIIQALRTIWHNPYRKLTTEGKWILVNEATNVDVDTILMMFHHPEYLHQSDSGSPLRNLPNKLRRYLPEKIFERHVVETLDNPENRFIKRFMDLILYFCEELKRQNYWEKAKSHQLKLEELENFVRYFRVNSIFADVGDMTIFPAFSQVLLKRDGYRECLSIYRLLNLSKIPIFNELQDAIDNRRVDQLYEYWCFFELSKRLAEVIGKDKSKLRFEIKEAEESGLGGGTKAYLGDDYELVYNKTFKGYSGDFRPDFALIKNNNLEIIFDAKFRFDLKRQEDEGDVFQNLEEEEKNALEKENFEVLAKLSDIYKMHTYRDALKCKSSIILFPGTKGVFFTNRNKIELENFCCEFLLRFNLEGVGAIPFIPLSKIQKKV